MLRGRADVPMCCARQRANEHKRSSARVQTRSLLRAGDYDKLQTVIAVGYTD